MSEKFPLIAQKAAGFAVVLMLGCGTFLSTWAASTYEEQLRTLEMKFFFHDYAQQDDTTRITRLEKTIFGQTLTGSESQRLAHLAKAVDSNQGLSIAAATGAADTANRQTKPAADNYAMSPPPAYKAPERPTMPNKSPTYTPPVERFADAGEAEEYSPASSVPPMPAETAEDEENNYSPPAPALAPLMKRPATANGNQPIYSPAPAASVASSPSPAPAYAPSRLADFPPTAPSLFRAEQMPSTAPRLASWSPSGLASRPAQSSGLMGQLENLEDRVFGKIYLDSVPNRLTRLENRVFPQENVLNSSPWPYRVQRLQSELRLSNLAPAL